MLSVKSPRLVVGLVGVAASAVFVYLAVRHLDLGAIGPVWHRARILPWVPLAVASYVVGHLLRGQRCRMLVQRETALSLAAASNIVVVGYASNNVLPARMGELVRAGMLVERSGIPMSQALAVTFIERLFDGIAILLLLAASMLTSATATWIERAAKLGSVVFGLASAVVLTAVLAPNLLLSLAARVSALFGPRWHDRAVRLASNVMNGAVLLRRPSGALWVVTLSFAIWMCEAGMFACILPAFSLPLRMQFAVVAMSVTNLGLLIPSTPGFVGPFHFFCSQALVSLGVEPALALSYAVLVHLTFYVPVTLWGVGAVLWYGMEVGATAALARAAKTSPEVTRWHGMPVRVIAHVEEPLDAPTDASDFTFAIVEAILPPVAIPERERVRAVRDVATFVGGQISALPPRLQSMFHAGMAMFRFYVRIRYLRSFCALPLERRRAAVQVWAYGGIGLFRQLFRPVRSVALLAYYDLAIANKWIDQAEGAEEIAAVRGAHLPLLGTHG